MTEIETQAVSAEQLEVGRYTGQPLWLDIEPEPIYAVFHAAPNPADTRVAALILPTFGWDNDWSYRPRRAWATALAQSGVPALRLDFPGTEDSVGSPLKPNQVQSWVDATVSAAAWLRERSGCERLVVVGIGLGGLIAYKAIAAGAAIDDLLLWGVRESGRAYMRELRTFSAIIEEPADNERDQARPDDLIGIGGHRMSVETAEAVGAIRLADTPLPDAQLRRVLLVGRDAHGLDGKLKSHLEQSGAEVTTLEADDHKLLVARAELELVPSATISASIEWMLKPGSEQLEPISHKPVSRLPVAVSSVTFEHNGVRIRESLTEAMTSAGRLLGIISEPVSDSMAPHCVLLTNAGPLRRTGPCRISVEIARHTAAMGTPAARFDRPGLGDSDGTAAKAFERTAADDAMVITAISEIYDHLAEQGIAERFVPAGLCLAGYVATLMVPGDTRSIGAIGLNTPTLKWTDLENRALLRTLAAEMGPQATTVGLPTRPTRPSAMRERWQRLGRLRYVAENQARMRLAAIGFLWRNTHRKEIASAAKMIDKLGQTQVPVFFELSGREPLVHVFSNPKLARQLERFPNIRIEHLETNDHDLRPLWVQDVVLQRISGMLDELRSTANGDAPNWGARHALPETEIPELGNQPSAADR